MLEIRSGKTVAQIDPKGGYVVSLKNSKGDILFPRKIYTDSSGAKKVRGGSHVCMPNFGPVATGELPQHGYGRISHWRSVFEEPDEAFLVLDTGPEPYRHVRTELHYVAHANSFEMTLSVRNYGNTVVRFAPAFHPYFAVTDAEMPVLSGAKLHLDQLADTRYFDSMTHRLELGSQTLVLESSELQRWAVWTDLLDKYVCVEPTMAGYAFLEEAADNQLIRPGVTRLYSFTLSWR